MPSTKPAVERSDDALAKRGRRKEARPGELLDAALDLFVEKGFAATRSEEVALRAGVSKGTLFLYFPTKEELFKAVIRENLSGRFAEWNEEFETFAGSTADMIRYCMRVWWERIGATRASGITKLIISEARNFPDIAAFYQQEVIQPGTELIRRILQRGVAARRVPHHRRGIHRIQHRCADDLPDHDETLPRCLRAAGLSARSRALRGGADRQPAAGPVRAHRKPGGGPRMKRNWKTLLLVLVAVVVVGAGWRVVAARRAQQIAQQQATAQKAQPVVELAASDVVHAQSRELQRGLPVSGSLRAVDSAFVKARVAGELLGLSLREGDAVHAHQVVARIDPAESQARLHQAQEQADAAKTQIDIAQRQYDNNKALVDQGFISRTALDTSASTLAGAQASYKAAVAAVDLARKGMEDTVLRAPISGVVSQRLTQTGERVAIDARVIEIVDLSHLEMEATLSAADSVDVRVGQDAVLQVEGSQRAVAAKVVRINPSAQAGSRSVLVYLAIADTTGLRQGLFAQGVVKTGNASALAVPLAAVRTDKPAPYVQVVENRQVMHRAVQTGARGEVDQESWVAVSGVPEGAAVIRGHVGPLREGTAVKFTQAAPSPQPSPASGRGSKSPSP